MGASARAVSEGFAAPTEEKLDDLGPGCFVQVMNNDAMSCWAEIVSENDLGYECIAHPTLSDIATSSGLFEGSRLMVKRDQITALGCERYCFC